MIIDLEIKPIYKPTKRHPDITGQTIGNFLVTSYAGKNGRKNLWNCLCLYNKCNKEITLTTCKLKKQKSCGCFKLSKVKDLTGKKFGWISVIEYAYNDKTGKAVWKCSCDCDLTKHHFILGASLITGATKSCGCPNYRKHAFSRKYKWVIGDLSVFHWKRILRNAKKRNIKVNITMQEASELFDKQDKKCALSGRPLLLYHSSSSSKDWKSITASFDRIDSNKDYFIENVQWIHKDINRMKNIFPQEYFIDICKDISSYQLIKNR